MKQASKFAILILIISILGIGVAVYLSQQKQTTKSSASTNESYTIANDGKFGSTPYTLLEAYPKTPNSIDTMTFYPFGEDGKLTQRFQYVARALNYTWFEIGSMLSDGAVSYQIDPNQDFFPNLFSQEPLLNSVKAIKALNRQEKVGIHAGGIVTQNSWFILYNYLNEEDFLHDQAGKPIWLDKNDQTPKFRWQRFVNISNPSTRIRIINGFRDFYIRSGRNIDGFLLDGYVFNEWIAQMPEAGCKEGPCRTRDFWINNMITLTQEIKSGLPPEVGIYYNGFSQGNSDPFNVNGAGFAQYTDGALMEHPHEIITSPTIFKEYLEGAKKLTDSGKGLFFWVQLQILNYIAGESRCTNPSDTDACGGGGSYCIIYWDKSRCTDYFDLHNRPNDNAMQRFFLATYLLIQQKGLTYFGYQPAGPLDSGMLFFYKEWNINFGTAQDIYRQDAVGLYYRHYTYGLAVVNPTDQPLTYNFPDNLTYFDWERGGQGLRRSVTIAPKSGHFFLKSENIPSTTPVIRKGDLNNNGVVDIFDFNTLVSTYGQNGQALPADLNSNTKVDIFDFNILIGNFGK